MRFKKIVPFVYRFSDFLPRKHKIFSDSEDLSCKPFFILGSGRNGSTLLGSILNQHSKIVITPEEYSLPYVIIKYKLLNWLKWENIIKIITAHFFEKQNNVRWRLEYDDLYSNLIRLPKNERTLQRVVDEIYIFFINEKNKNSFEVWGDKTPKITEFTKYIYPIYPDSKYVFLLRDGRDVISSILKRRKPISKKSNKEILDYAVWKWNNSIAMWEWLKKQSDNQNLHITFYEDLVTDTEKTIKAVTNHIGFNYENNMLNFQESINFMGVEKMAHHQNLKNPINPQSIGKWQKELTKEELNYIMPKIRHNLVKYRYITK